jgi:hypothetical protein
VKIWPHSVAAPRLPHQKGMRRILVCAGIIGITSLAPSAAQASSITFTGSNGSGLAASVTFDDVGGNLQVTLTSTGGDPAIPADILTGIFFDMAGSPTLTVLSAILGSGSFVTNGGTTDPGGVVGGEWAYKTAPSLAWGADYGISSTGLGLFGPGNLFPGNNLAGPVEPDGDQYGIVSTAQTAGNDQPGIAGTPFIEDTVVLTLSGLPDGFDPSQSISNVTFQFGSSLEEPHLPGSPGDPSPVPEPASLVLFGSGLTLLSAKLHKRTRQ